MNVRDHALSLMRAADIIGEGVAVDAILALARDEARREVEAERAEWRAKRKQQRAVSAFVSETLSETNTETRAPVSPLASPLPESVPTLTLIPSPIPEADPDPERAIPVLPGTEEALIDLEPFPVNGRLGLTWRMRVGFFGELANAFPAIDVLAECRKARVWILANPANRKTARGMEKFLLGWIGRAANNRQAALLPSARGSPARDVRLGHVRVEEGQKYPEGEQQI